LFDELIEKCNSNTNLVILSTDNLNASKVAQIAIYQMLDTANWATFELELDKITKKLFG
jgi:hypothetical protein